ncbi:MAG: tetratricopeptide repeat protein [Bacteroidales bacterium]|nr:tetratricopeptide repeat protein [Bacteroidales bacterium]
MRFIKTPLLTALLALALVGCKQGSTDFDNLTDSEKLEILDIRLERHPKDAEALADRATVLFNLGRTNEALADINKAVSLAPDKVDYRLQQADLYFASGNVENSYKALAEAERLDPESNEVQLKMGEVTFYSRDYDRSLKCLTNVTEREPDNRTALFMKGFIYKEMGDTASAVTLFRRVCDLYPDYAPAFEELGVLYATRNNPLALEYLQTAIRIDPNNTNTRYALAMYHQENGDMEQAEALYRNILDLNPNSADAWHNLGYIELTHYHDYERAAAYFDSALAINPQMENANANKSLAQEAMKK